MGVCDICSKNDIEFWLDPVTGALKVVTDDLQELKGKELEKHLGVSLGLPSSDTLLREEFHAPIPAQVKINAGR